MAGEPDALDEALARREERTLSKALTFSAGGAVHCVRTSGAGIALRGAKVTLFHFMDGAMRVRYKNRTLDLYARQIAAHAQPRRGREDHRCPHRGARGGSESRRPARRAIDLMI